MLRVQQLIKKVAPTNATVLLLGESGAGKTLVAEIIHELSSRSRGPFVKVNSAALPKNLLESELFGYEKGAFTGAEAPKAGRVEEANGGAIFLDEIGELPPQLQAKLLRFLQDHEFERLGGAKTRKVDVRIIAATNADLAKAVQNGRFREDLYYRLNVFPMAIPPLRERKADLEGLIEFFVNKVCARYGCDLQFTREALQTLIHYPWPGNVREMENLVERLAIIWGTSKIGLNQLAPYLGENVANYPGDRKNSTSQGRSGSLMDMERERIIEALERNNWVQSRAAKELGITLRQIGYRIKKYGLEESLRQRRIHI
jgi:Nif-specific regulatory protein